MEGRLQRFILATLLAVTGSSLHAAEGDHSVLDDVISPDLKRRQINEDKIDSENIEVGFFAGVLSVEDFGSNDVYGLRAALHVTEDIFIETNLGLSALQETSFETLSGDTRLLTDKQRDLIYYNLSLGWNIFPGEIYVKRWAFNSNFYLLGGAGNTDFADNEYFTYHFGGGFRFFATDWLALHIDFRNHVMSHAIFGEKKNIQNLESRMGLTLFF